MLAGHLAAVTIIEVPPLRKFVLAGAIWTGAVAPVCPTGMEVNLVHVPAMFGTDARDLRCKLAVSLLLEAVEIGVR